MSLNEDNTPNEETVIVAKQISDGDPLKESEIDSESQNRNVLETELEENENEIENDLESESKSDEKPMETGLEDIEKEKGEVLEGDETASDENKESSNEEEPVTKAESDGDPLMDGDPDPEPIEPEEPKVSDEYRALISKWAIDGINFIDEIKTEVCVALGGGYASDYATKPFIKKMFLDSTKELLKQKEIGPPSPLQAFLFSLAAMTAPPILMVLFRRNIKPAANNPNRQKVEASEEAQAKTDYTNTVEYQEERDQFKVHASGAYMYGLGGREDYVSAQVADAYPSSEVQKLIDEGKTSAEIKKIIYG